MRIAIIGRSQLLYETALLLLNNGHDIRLVVTAKEAPEYTKTSADFEQLARKLGASYIYTPKINLGQYVEEIKSLGTIDIGISINYTGVILQELIDLFPLGILNAHAGDLPRYRGNAPLAWAIINGEKRAGLCIHKMIGGELDSGNIIARTFHDISVNTRIGELFEWIEKEIPPLMLEAINKIEKDPSCTGEEQSKDPKDALRGYPRLFQDGKIDWSNSAESILRLVNASSEPFGGAFCEFEHEQMIIWRAENYNEPEQYCAVPGQISRITADAIIVITGNGTLRVTDCTYKGIRSGPSSFINSIRKRLC
jgi:methionyl-tRNA formyltransferase